MTGKTELDGESIVKKLLNQQLERKQQEEIIIENQKEWKRVCNALGSSANGKHFLKMMIKHAGIFVVDPDDNGIKLLKEKGRKEFYLRHVRPYLEVDVRIDLET